MKQVPHVNNCSLILLSMLQQGTSLTHSEIVKIMARRTNELVLFYALWKAFKKLFTTNLRPFFGFIMKLVLTVKSVFVGKYLKSTPWPLNYERSLKVL